MDCKFYLLVTTLLIGACTHTQLVTDPVQTGFDPSKVELHYSSGLSHYHLLTENKESIVRYKLYRDQSLVDEGNLQKEEYLSWLTRVRDFAIRHGQSQKIIEGAGREAFHCNAPVRVQLELEFEKRTYVGCSTGEEGPPFSSLIREAESMIKKRY